MAELSNKSLHEVCRNGTLKEVTEVVDTELKSLESSEEGQHDDKYFTTLLSVIEKFPELKIKTIELLANLARKDHERKEAVKANSLLPMLAQLKDSSHDIQFQALRAIGNLCYEYDDSRATFLDNGGCEQLTAVLKSYSKLSVTPDNEKLKCVVCGCLSNTCSDQNDKIGKQYITSGAHNHIVAMLSNDGETDNVITLALQALSSLITSDVSLTDSLIETELPSTLTILISCCTAVEDDLPFMEPLIDILSTFMEKDKWKVVMVDNGCVPHLLSVKDTQYRQKFIDLVVLMLMEDECMTKLFADGSIVSKSIEWMGDDNQDLSLKTTAALIIANIARTDANCVRLINSKVVPPLVRLTQIALPEQEVAKVYHAALSALRNLALPDETKSILLKEGVVDAAIKKLQSTMSFVQFKALGTLRLLSQKQADICAHIIKQDRMIERLTELCGDSTTGGHLTAEGCRLLCVLVKYSKNSEAMKQVAAHGGCKWIVSLLESDHNVMINEGLIAVSLLIALNSGEITKSLLEYDLLQKVIKLLQNDKATPEILFNSISLLEALQKTGTLLNSEANLKDAVQNLSSHSNDAVKTKAISLYKNI